MLTFTLDTNCIIALDEKRPEAAHLQSLIAAHDAGNADVGLVAISASERQKKGGPLEDFRHFEQRLASLGLDRLVLLPPMFYWDLGFWDQALWADDEKEALELKIHSVLFPNIDFLWSVFCQARGVDQNSHEARWRNAKCDVQALWTHIHHHRDVFVTSDMNFHHAGKKPQLIQLGAGRIESPQTAISLV